MFSWTFDVFALLLPCVEYCMWLYGAIKKRFLGVELQKVPNQMISLELQWTMKFILMMLEKEVNIYHYSCTKYHLKCRKGPQKGDLMLTF